ncbi:response regulator transcription factor [Alkalilacustris brevis]|uniref:response regulator transcription factor n=1 Tax=Alkalilacustris brevis TaxID=2026338 RepID=UPI001EE3C8A8|nr:response regulator transcription factor [Alkalilacustris brevis]
MNIFRMGGAFEDYTLRIFVVLEAKKIWGAWMVGDISSKQGEDSRQPPQCEGQGSIIFWGGPIAFSNWVLRIAESESRASVVRVDNRDGLDRSKGKQCCIFFDDTVADEVLANPDFNPGEYVGARWILAYRSDNLARRLLALRRERPELTGIGLLPMNLSVGLWTLMFRLILSGDFVVPGKLLDPETGPAPPDHKVSAGNRALTRRESEVLRMVAKGMRNKMIAHNLGLSEHTVKLHLHNLIGKIGVSNRTQAAQWYFSRPHGEAE